MYFYCLECEIIIKQPDVFGEYTDQCPKCGNILRLINDSPRIRDGITRQSSMERERTRDVKH